MVAKHQAVAKFNHDICYSLSFILDSQITSVLCVFFPREVLVYSAQYIKESSKFNLTTCVINSVDNPVQFALRLLDPKRQA